MSQTVTLNGVSYTVPEENDNNWGGYTTTYLVAIASNMLQKNGGAFNLTDDVDFGSTYGLIAGYFKSASSDIAESGVIRLSNTDDIAFRNIADSGDILLSADASTDGILNFNSVALVTVSATQTLTNKTLTSPTLTSPVLNTSVSGSAIDTDLTSVSASDDTLASAKAIKTYVDAQVTAADLDFSGDSGGAQSVDLDSQALTVEGGTGVDTTGSAQKISIAIDSTVTTNDGSQTLTNKTIDVDSNTVSNIEVDNLKTGVLDTDLSTVAATDTTIPSAKATKTQLDTKQATIDSSNRLNADLIHDGSVSNTEFGYINSLTSNAQTQLDAKQATIDSGNRLNANLVGDGSVSDTEFGYINSVTSNVQTQLDAKQATITGAATTITSADLTASRVVQSNVSGKVEASSVTTTTLGYLDATSSIQTQLDAKAPSSSASLTSPTVTDFIELDHQGSDPSAPGGSGDTRIFAKDGKVYKIDQAGSVSEVGSGGAGDAYTIHLKSAEASDPVNTAPWYTGNNPVPGGGGSIGGTWELSTSNPLINIDDKTKVFHYSNGTSNRKNDYFEIELDVPNYAKGHNLVVSLFYRTVGAEDTDFLFFSRDRSADYETTTTSSGSLNTITLTSATGFAVGDRICIQDTSDARHFRYVTAVSGSDITFGGDAVTVGSGDVVVSKYFTDELDTIAAENNTTNYEGKIRKWAFQINDTTTKIRVGFLYDNSATSTNELFFDQILLSSNQFLQASTELVESYAVHDHAGFQGYVPYYESSGVRYDNTGTLVTVSNSSTTGFVITANQECIVSATFNQLENAADGYYWGWTLNAATGTAISSYGSSTNNVLSIIRISDATNRTEGESQSVEIKLSPGDYIMPHTSATTNPPADNWWSNIMFTAKSVANSSILLSSQDEIFSDWVSYTPTITGQGTVSDMNARWRRVGSDIEIDVWYIMGSLSGATPTMSLPSGITPDQGKLPPTQKAVVGEWWWADDGFVVEENARSGIMIFYGSNWDRVAFIQKGDGATGWEHQDANAIWGQGDDGIALKVKFPVAGWTSTFNPVLSMPLVDFSSFENNFSARISNGGSAAIVSQTTPNWISSVSRSATGEVTITFISGFFGGVIPGVVATCTDRDGRETTCKSLSASSVTVTTTDGGSQEDNNFTVMATRQGSDYRQPPQPTAAVIKPAVLFLTDQRSSGTVGGSASSSGSNWYARTLNTISGESWFLNSLSSSTFQLQPGHYTIFAQAQFMNTNHTKIKLYDTSNSKDVVIGMSSYISASAGTGPFASLNGSFVITANTNFELHYRVSNTNSTNDLGQSDSFGVNEIYANVRIEKLK